jgi:uncharacterized membrane protein
MKVLKYLSAILAIVALLLACVSGRMDLDVSAPWQQVIGNVHPLLLHLPIGGLSFLLLLELSKWLKWIRADDGLLYFILVVSSLFASASFFSGFALAKQGGFPQDLLSKHLWCGAAYVSCLAWCAVLKQRSNGSGRVLYSLSLACAVVSMILTGHFGGLMTHGDPLAPLFYEEYEAVNTDKPTDELLVFNEVVQPILAGKCYSCHGNGKSKGKLSLSTYEDILAGGKSADRTLIPGNPQDSLLIRSLLYPLDDDRHMPPMDQTQLTDGEVRILSWWVSDGAQRELTVAEVEAPVEIVTAITELVPEEVREQREIARLEKVASKKAAAKQQRMVLHDMIEADIPVALRAMLRFVSPHNADVHFSSVSLQGQFGDADFATLEGLAPHLTSVDLSHSSISSATIEALSACEKIHSLRLAGTSVGTADVARLSHLGSLRTLSLHSTEVDSAVLPHLAKMKSLRQLYLWSTKVPSAEIEAFREAHPEIQVVY